ncbi:hypothetical protein LP316_02590 [Thalassotalea sp. LPB0316]|uniref:hypothetical protein n=1 Tax=Thalassotalea sp. LPB0316 TaxID=2769490 RepID=UPI001866368D|nr:hypothetical protein [Thalassotalea sp. LPB0316]QOL26210.1 hypothetical protein LP316_02590 [Thalassotalea sp. LPB0316]
MNNPETKKNRRSFILLLFAFILPIVLAKLALEQQWFNYGVTNQGQLVEGELTLENTGINLPSVAEKQWLMLYVMPDNCQDKCDQVLSGVNNTYIALGKEMPRVTPVGLFQQVITPNSLTNIRQQDWQFIKLADTTKQRLQQNHIYIVDPLGNIVVSHVIPENSDAIPAFGKAVVADFKKLLKYSRIG